MFVIYIQVGTPHPTPDYDEIAAVLRQAGHTIWVATPNEYRDLVFNDGTKAVTAVKMPAITNNSPNDLVKSQRLHVLWENWKFISRLRKLVTRMQPDVVQVNEARLPFLWCFPLGFGQRTRYILDWRQIAERSFSGSLAGLHRVLHLIRRRLPSRYIYSQACFLDPAGAERVLGRSWEKWGTVVPLAVSPDFLKTDLSTRNSDQDLKMPVRFIYIGSISRVRRLERIIDAAKKIEESSVNSNQFSVTFMGPDKSQGYYARLVEELELSHIIQFAEPIPYEKVPMALAQSDVALAYVPELPLDWHYHPTLKIMEYRAVGIPIIATNFKPNQTIVENGKNGLLVENTVESLAKAMLCFVNDQRFLQECKQNAQLMRQGNLWKDVALMYEKLYLSLMSG